MYFGFISLNSKTNCVTIDYLKADRDVVRAGHEESLYVLWPCCNDSFKCKFVNNNIMRTLLYPNRYAWPWRFLFLRACLLSKINTMISLHNIYVLIKSSYIPEHMYNSTNIRITQPIVPWTKYIKLMLFHLEIFIGDSKPLHFYSFVRAHICGNTGLYFRDLNSGLHLYRPYHAVLHLSKLTISSYLTHEIRRFSGFTPKISPS